MRSRSKREVEARWLPRYAAFTPQFKKGKPVTVGQLFYAIEGASKKTLGA